ncbi:hypothetical protein H6F67_06580 [Microcoleus sp. FACHB-1515]|uniref:DUF7226 domain-containing protein n=1 Tax=Cyanophyceae TaxID=3028117 RepID=UPI0016850117|nr:hypothetical protein [Microcoleus sp. FACHB-1515]MBD2089517.1 hypothetical protein [Microcoleus sp. FACHB-1515]
MFQLISGNRLATEILTKLHKRDSRFDDAAMYLQRLAQAGHLFGAKLIRFAQDLSICEGFQISCRSCQIVYTVETKKKQIKIYGFEMDASQRFSAYIDSIETGWQSEETEVEIYIPQADRPDKLIRTLELVCEGYTNSFDLGVGLGHGGRKYNLDDIARHGSYFARAAEELKLLTHRKEGRSYKYELTTVGRYIATCRDRTAKERLLAKAMLGFYPVQAVFNEITRAKQNLTRELVEEIIELVSPGNHKAETITRRANCLMKWVTWVAFIEEVPIFHQNETQDTAERQLTLEF